MDFTAEIMDLRVYTTPEPEDPPRFIAQAVVNRNMSGEVVIIDRTAETPEEAEAKVREAIAAGATT